ncbi:MAG TPA: PspC domain-containing protein [Acidimicrobiales bacterium]
MDTAPEETPGSSGSSEATTATDQLGPRPSTPAGPAGQGGDQRLHRGGQSRMLAGVAAGLADYFDVDPTIVRVGFVALAFLGGLAVPLYAAGWLLIPDEDTDVSVAEELLARERAHGAF